MNDGSSQMTVYPLDGGMAEKIDSTDPSLFSQTRRWSAHEGWVGWEEEWKTGVVLHYYRSWLRFHLPPLAGDAIATLRLHLSSGNSNSGPLEVAVYSLEDTEEEWSSDGRRLGSLEPLSRFEPHWKELRLPSGSLRPNGVFLLELRTEREETGGFSSWCTAIFDLLPPGPQAEIILSKE